MQAPKPGSLAIHPKLEIIRVHQVGILEKFTAVEFESAQVILTRDMTLELTAVHDHVVADAELLAVALDPVIAELLPDLVNRLVQRMAGLIWAAVGPDPANRSISSGFAFNREEYQEAALFRLGYEVENP
jgi:hypothetical protein